VADGCVDPRTFVGVQLPRAAWAAPVLLLAVLALQAVPPDAFGRPVPGAVRKPCLEPADECPDPTPELV
jgi:hypothetical protein